MGHIVNSEEDLKRRDGEGWFRYFRRTGVLDVGRKDFWLDFVGLQLFGIVFGWCFLGDLFLRWFPR